MAPETGGAGGADQMGLQGLKGGGSRRWAQYANGWSVQWLGIFDALMHRNYTPVRCAHTHTHTHTAYRGIGFGGEEICHTRIAFRKKLRATVTL